MTPQEATVWYRLRSTAAIFYGDGDRVWSFTAGTLQSSRHNHMLELGYLLCEAPEEIVPPPLRVRAGL